ncbi:MAG TPA: energy transducer TonB [Gemmatimonadaceae bacterium]|nr:energy transducer TonB [Gemmatimonadaceae bacterium]
MLDVLLESRHVRPPRPVVATTLSAAAHAALVLALLGGTTAAVTEDDSPLTRLAVRFLAPPQAPPQEAGERIAFMAMPATGSPQGSTSPDAVPVQVTSHDFGDPVTPRKVAMAVELDPAMLLSRAAKSVGAYTLIELDSVAERDPRSAAPDYPPDLLAKNVEGYATFRFVIDSTGLVDMATVKVVDSSNKEFVKAVEDAMPRMRFRPAMRAAQYVRQLVEQPFRFRIQPTMPVPNPGRGKPGQP